MMLIVLFWIALERRTVVKKVFCFILAMVLCASVAGVAVAATCPTGEHEYQDYYIDYSYVDMGDYHEVYTEYVSVCILCGASYRELAPLVGVEGHNLAMTHFDLNHDSATDTHKYTYTCVDCGHVIVFFGACDGPPCEVGFIPMSLIYALVK